MKKIDVNFVLNTQSVDKTISIDTNIDSVTVKLNVFNLGNYELSNELKKITFWI